VQTNGNKGGRGYLLIVPAAALGSGALAATWRQGRALPWEAGADWLLAAALGIAATPAAWLLVTLAMSFFARIAPARAMGAAVRPLLPLLFFWPLLAAIYVSDDVNHRVAETAGVGWLWLVPVVAAGFWAVLAVAARIDGPGDGFAGMGRGGDFGTSPVMTLMQFLALRLPLLLLVTPWGLWERGSDFGAYAQRAQLGDGGLLPYVDYWLEYPPLFPWLAALARQLAGGAAGGYERFDVALGLLLLGFEAGVLLFTYLIAERAHGRATAYRVATLYTLLFLPLYLGRRSFEALPLFFAMGGLYLVIRNRRHTAAAMLAFGFMAKVFPAVLLLVLLRTRRLRDGWREVATFAGTALLVALPLLVAGPRFFFASYQNMISRPPWESLWALAGGYYSFGWVHRTRTVTDTATEFAQGVPLPVAATALLAALLLLAYAYVFVRVRPVSGALAVVRLAIVVLAIFAIYLKGWSPQFTLWFLPLILLAYPGGKGFAIATGFSLLAVLENPGYFVWWSESRAALWAIVLARTAALLWLGADQLRQLGRGGVEVERMVVTERVVPEAADDG
jgi:hypothetical protein